MEKIPENFLEFDEFFHGRFVDEKNYKYDLDMKAIIKYCRENKFDLEKLSDDELENLKLRNQKAHEL